MKQIDCKSIREVMINKAKIKLDNIYNTLDRKLKLVVIQVTGDDASDIYVRNKIKTCEDLGIKCEHAKLSTSVTYDFISSLIDIYNTDPNVDGIILQLPLPNHLKQYQHDLLNKICCIKDVDGLTDANVARLWTGQYGIRPATAEAVMQLLPDDLSGKSALILGRSDLVGKPLIKMLMDRNATISVCHSKTTYNTINSLMNDSDIVISAVGKPRFLRAIPYLDSNKVTFIDVGINRDENGKICGDIWISHHYGTNCEYTPVPGGVGILTTAQIPLNLIKCYEFGKLADITYSIN